MAHVYARLTDDLLFFVWTMAASI